VLVIILKRNQEKDPAGIQKIKTLNTKNISAIGDKENNENK
tara:strand:+ start:323 stop:445 length:123 start_codon:yes stop_codon:yes gene_type:complete